jgi:Lon protease-like protein
MHATPLQFDRPIPLFPLPNCVLFPGVVQPLHIFEPRYRDMMEDTLEDQSALAMVLLKPGWEKTYYGYPPIHDMLCVGRIVAHERLDDGKFNLLLHGLTRARVDREQRCGQYRVAQLRPVLDVVAPTGVCGHEILQRKVLRELFQRTPLKDLTVVPSLATFFDDSVPISRLIDALAFSLVQDVEFKQRMLEELDPLKRGELLLQDLVQLASRLADKAASATSTPASSWPPPLGVN